MFYGYYHVPDSFYDSIYFLGKKLSRVSSEKRMDSLYSWCSSGNLLVDTNVDSEEESVLIMPPVYYPFFNSIKETGRQLVECPLLKEDEYYKMDLELFENKNTERECKSIYSVFTT